MKLLIQVELPQLFSYTPSMLQKNCKFLLSSSIRGTVFAANIDIGVAIYQCERPEWASSHA